MKIWIVLGAALTSLAAVEHAQAPRISAGCRAAIESVNWARETLADPDVSPARLEQLLATLELRSGSCPTAGDVWYYRSVLERQLKRPAADATYSLNKAREYGSAALSRETDAGPATPAPAFDPSVPVKNKWALVVGIDQFASGVRPLGLAVKDARDLAQTLTDPAVGKFPAANVRLLTDSEATLVKIKDQIGWIRSQAGPDDLVLIFFASHGSPREDDPNGVSYILAYDTDPARVFSTGFQMVDLVENVSRDIRAGRVVVVLDTCFSGGAGIVFSRSVTIVPAPSTNYNVAFKRLQIAPGRAVMASSRANEEAQESPELRNGYFTHFLVEGLASPGVGNSLRDLFTYVESQVSTSVRAKLGRDQHPVLDAGPMADRIDLKAAPGR